MKTVISVDDLVPVTVSPSSEGPTLRDFTRLFPVYQGRGSKPEITCRPTTSRDAVNDLLADRHAETNCKCIALFESPPR